MPYIVLQERIYCVCTACALHVRVHCMCTACACALHAHCMCMCTACALYAHCMRTVCALYTHCMRTVCALHDRHTHMHMHSERPTHTIRECICRLCLYACSDVCICNTTYAIR